MFFLLIFFFFFNDTATTEIYTLSLHDALPISLMRSPSVMLSPEHILQTGFGFRASQTLLSAVEVGLFTELGKGDRKSTRLNSSHSQISYAVFCLKKKKKKKNKSNNKR